ncbi:ATP/GTP-binding protein [Streptomyces sp. NPDC001941]|uniref:GTP-binding protein n=1 Tax=Streptomyces sp. NPDC001941 TaxID=3154659 RepID=UPI0033241C3C
MRVKVVVAGGFGAGKTTFVASVSEIDPLTTEEVLTDPGSTIDSLDGVAAKTTTTVALDFGRITLPSPDPAEQPVVLMLFGTPGQDRFRPMWDSVADGAHGAVVLADTRRLADCFNAIDYFERHQLPFIVAVNRFPDTAAYHPDQIRSALALDPDLPLVVCDARERASSLDALITLVVHALHRLPAPPEPAGARP